MTDSLTKSFFEALSPYSWRKFIFGILKYNFMNNTYEGIKNCKQTNTWSLIQNSHENYLQIIYIIDSTSIGCI